MSDNVDQPNYGTYTLVLTFQIIRRLIILGTLFSIRMLNK